MMRFIVGERFPVPEAITTDGARLEIDPNWGLAVLTCSGLSNDEIRSFNEDAFTLALTDHDNIMFLVCQTGEIGWYEIPYSASIYPPEVKNELALYKEKSPLFFVLVENFDMTIKAMRAVIPDPKLSSCMKQAIDKQLKLNMSLSEHEELVESWYQTCPSTIEFLSCAVATQKIPEGNSDPMTNVILL